MEVLVPRFSKYPFSRTVVSALVVAVAAGAAYEFHRQKTSNASVPPLQMSVASSTVSGPIANASAPIPPKPTIAATPAVAPPAPGPLITQTPEVRRVASNALRPGPASPAYPVSASPVSASPVSAPPVTAGGAVSVNSVTPATAAPASPAQPPVNSATVLTDAAARVSTGDLLGARSMLNTALLSGKLSAADTESVKKQISEINKTVIFSAKQFPKDPLGGTYTVKAGDHLSSIGTAHQVPYELLMQLNGLANAKMLRYGQNLKIINGPFHIVISKSKFTMDVYLGSPGGADSMYVTSYPVGLGTDNSTPTGTWSIKNKVPHPTYFPPEGHAGAVLEPGDPKNPLGDYWLGLEGTDGQAVGQKSYGIHGTIDPSSIGKQSSMGCIRLRNEDVAMVYKMLFTGKSIVIVKD